jgi:hypothetical protein
VFVETDSFSQTETFSQEETETEKGERAVLPKWAGAMLILIAVGLWLLLCFLTGMVIKKMWRERKEKERQSDPPDSAE